MNEAATESETVRDLLVVAVFYVIGHTLLRRSSRCVMRGSALSSRFPVVVASITLDPSDSRGPDHFISSAPSSQTVWSG
ncbi:hypothetical protein [Halomontanus rarus]|uniref:hypothetical protein n=1 Tax=Halomontanus rarus TaxID=3034020 RepID=UPI00307C10EE